MATGSSSIRRRTAPYRTATCPTSTWHGSSNSNSSTSLRATGHKDLWHTTRQVICNTSLTWLHRIRTLGTGIRTHPLRTHRYTTNSIKSHPRTWPHRRRRGCKCISSNTPTPFSSTPPPILCRRWALASPRPLVYLGRLLVATLARGSTTNRLHGRMVTPRPLTANRQNYDNLTNFRRHHLETNPTAEPTMTTAPTTTSRHTGHLGLIRGLCLRSLAQCLRNLPLPFCSKRAPCSMLLDISCLR